MSFYRIMALTRRIGRQILRDRRTLALIFLAPILIMSLLYLVLSGGSSPRTLALVRPTGNGSTQVNTMLDSMMSKNNQIHIITIEANAVDATLKNGEADAALVFPANFAEDALSGKQPEVFLVLEGSDPNVANAMKAVAEDMTRQLGISLALAQLHSTANAPRLNLNNLPLKMGTPLYLYGGEQYTFNDSLAPVFIGLFSFFFVFLLTSVAFLRERSQGTIERVMVSPLKRSELVLGYIFGFTTFALIQSLVILLFVVFALQIHYSGNLALVFLVTALLTIGSVNLGIFLSTFARNEFQIIQFIPLVFGVQVFLSGIFWPIKDLPGFLQPVAYMLPLTYANEALRGVMLKGQTLIDIAVPLTALSLFVLLMVLLSSLTMRRQIA